MSITISSLYHLTKRTEDAKTEALDVNLDLMANELAGIKEEANYHNLKMSYTDKLNKFSVELAKTPRDKTEFVLDFQKSLKREFDGELANLSPTKAKMFQLKMGEDFANQQISAMDSDKKLYLGDLKAVGDALEDNLRVASSTFDPTEITKSKDEYFSHLEELKNTGVLGEKEYKLRMENTEKAIFKNQAKAILSNFHSISHKVGEDNALSLLETVRESDQFNQLSFQDQKNLNTLEKRVREESASLDVTDESISNDIAFTGFLKGSIDEENFEIVNLRYNEKLEKAIRGSTGKKRKALKREKKASHFLSVGALVGKRNPKLLVNEDADEFIAEVLDEDVDKLDKTSEEYLLASKVHASLRKEFGDFKNTDSWEQFSQFAGDGNEEDPLDTVKVSNKESESLVDGMLKQVDPQLANKIEGFSENSLNLVKKYNTRKNFTKETILSSKDAKQVFDTAKTLFKAGDFQGGQAYIKMFTDAGLNPFPHLDKSYKTATKIFDGHMAILADSNYNLSDGVSREIGARWSDYHNMAINGTDTDKADLNKIYKHVYGLLQTAKDSEDDENFMRLEKLNPNFETASTFISAVVSQNAMAKGLNTDILEAESLKDLLESESTASLYANLTDEATVNAGDRVFIGRRYLNDNKAIMEEGKVGGAITNEGVPITKKSEIPSEVKQLRVFKIIGNSLDPTKMNSNEYSSELTSTFYAISKLALPGRVSSPRSLKNFVVRNGVLNYKDIEGVEEQVKIGGETISFSLPKITDFSSSFDYEFSGVTDAFKLKDVEGIDKLLLESLSNAVSTAVLEEMKDVTHVQDMSDFLIRGLGK